MPAKGHTAQIHQPRWEGTVLTCTYTFAGEQFVNRYDFAAAPANINTPLAQKLCHWVAITTAFGLFSVEYFDALICDFPLTQEDTDFFETLIFNGFGEFRLVNHLAMNTRTTVRGTGNATAGALQSDMQPGANGPLLLNGGGKDGSVSAKLLQDAGIDFTWFQRGNGAAQAGVAAVWEAPTFIVMRHLDPNRKNRKYSGHRPMSAGIAFLAIMSAYLFGYSDVIASNEASANEGNLSKDGVYVNHQYSKSFAFEQDVQNLISTFGVPVRYFSLLRPLHELQIAFIAANIPAQRLGAIISCNNGTKTGKWCLACAKCAFVALVMTAASPNAAAKIWGSKTVINTPDLTPYLLELLDPVVEKPLECVGTVLECQTAAKIILDHSGYILDANTKRLLETYAVHDAAKIVSLLNSFDNHAIPSEYRHIADTMAATLHQKVQQL